MSWLFKFLLSPFSALLALSAGVASAAPTSGGQPLSLNDVLNVSRVLGTAMSPDGKWVATVIQRPAAGGEVYGRTLYEFDPARSDVWLISPGGGTRVNLTNGSSRAAGYWCASWSPDGQYLAMLSTAPEGSEPKGGNNVRLYVWDRSSNKLNRLSSAGLMSQTMAGVAQYRSDFRAPGRSGPERCSRDENAPFTWVDDHQLLAAVLPEGEVAGLIDEYGRPFREALRTQIRIRNGQTSTDTSVESGGPAQPAQYFAELHVFDVRNGSDINLDRVPIYPFRGELTVSVAPDRRNAAVLASTAGLTPQPPALTPGSDDSWEVRKELGFLRLDRDQGVRWITPEGAFQFPLDLAGWSPDSTQIAFRARAAAGSANRQLFAASSNGLVVHEFRAPAGSAGSASASSAYASSAYAFWLNSNRLLARIEPVAGSTAPSRNDWYILSTRNDPANVTKSLTSAPDRLVRGTDDRFYASADDTIQSLNPANGQLKTVARLRRGQIVWPTSGTDPNRYLILAQQSEKNEPELARFDVQSRKTVSVIPDVQAGNPIDNSQDGRLAIYQDLRRDGSSLSLVDMSTGASRTVLNLNGHLASVKWGEERIIEYKSLRGKALKAAVILPPGYDEAKSYPVMTWVYPGYRIFGSNDYFLDPYLPGIYNLQLYAAKGYVVLIPSMPRDHPDGILASLPDGVLPALDRLRELKIGDPSRVAVVGQSLGGYAALGLISESDRFQAAVAISSITNLTSYYGEFDPTARGYHDIAHQKSLNWSISEGQPFVLGHSLSEAPDLFWRNSPLGRVSSIKTPVLLLQSEFDQRGSLSQAEEMFFSLYRQGSRAKLVRFWGESHAISQSPANVRRAFELTVDWLDRYLKNPAEAGPAQTSN